MLKKAPAFFDALSVVVALAVLGEKRVDLNVQLLVADVKS